MLLNEIWKPIKGYESLYEVSNYGRVKALARRKNCNRGYGIIKEHIMKPNNCDRGGYYRVPLTGTNHIKKYYLVHRLVAEAFIPNPDNLPEVNHKDSNKANNNIKNLEWCSRTYNIKYGYENGERITIKQLCNEIEELKSRLEKIEANCYKVKEEIC